MLMRIVAPGAPATRQTAVSACSCGPALVVGGLLYRVCQHVEGASHARTQGPCLR
jgi:hypothetical protein